MNKQSFRNKKYYRPLVAVYWGSLVVFGAALTILGFVASDVEIAGLVWAVILAGGYWLVKKIFYYFMFEKKFFHSQEK